MNRLLKSCRVITIALFALLVPILAFAEGPRVSVSEGVLEGIIDSETGLHLFKGIPFAAPPVGELRWRAPQAAESWEGVRQAKQFGARAMQLPIFGGMGFRSAQMSEDCLYLNVWAPAKTAKKKLPVLVYFYGGGFAAGDGSEARYDGASMAAKGMVAVTVNYRLGVFGFLAHPMLTEESPHKASGNYGLLDQHAALMWVKNNIAAFGGDPKRVTIAGESAGSMSVSAQMASPLSKNLIAGAIGESGSIIGAPVPAIPLAHAEAQGVAFIAGLGVDKPSLKAMRALPADTLLKASSADGGMGFKPIVDGYFLPKPPAEIYAAGEQARVPLLAGVNSAEMPHMVVLRGAEPTVENYKAALKQLYPKHFEEIFKLYPASNSSEVMDAAQALGSDRFISYGTWKWVELMTQTSKQPTYYYLYSHPRPPMRAEMGNAKAGFAGGVVKKQDKEESKEPPARGAAHAVEIEYAMGNLTLNDVYAWTKEDYQVSETMQNYFANFIKTGNPNGSGLPKWPEFKTGKQLVIDVKTETTDTAQLRKRYKFLDQFYLP